MAERQRDEHDISSAMNRSSTFLTIDWRYAGCAVFVWVSLIPYSDHLPVGEFGQWMAIFAALSGVLFWAWYYGRDPARLPTRLLSILRGRRYSALKRGKQ